MKIYANSDRINKRIVGKLVDGSSSFEKAKKLINFYLIGENIFSKNNATYGIGSIVLEREEDWTRVTSKHSRHLLCNTVTNTLNTQHSPAIVRPVHNGDYNTRLTITWLANLLFFYY